MKDKTAVEPLVVLFNDPRTPTRIRLAVAEALLKLEGAPTEVALLAALRSEDWHIRRNSAAILGQIRATWAIEPLARAALRDKRNVVRRTARAALRYIGTPQALKALKTIRTAMQKSQATKSPPPAGSPPKVPQTDVLSDLLSEDITESNEAESSTSTPHNHENTNTALSWPKHDKIQRQHRAPTQPLNPDRAPKTDSENPST